MSSHYAHHGQHGQQHGHGHHGQQSQRYDSVVYHQSMFLKKLSHPTPHDKNQKVSWREKLGHFLESKPENIFIFALIILDLLIICAQLFIVDQYEKCHAPTPAPHIFTSESEEDHKIKKIGEILDITSLVILCVLATEMVLLLIAFDVKFFKQPLYILDAVVISVTLWIEVKQWDAEHHQGEGGSSVANISTFIIFFRLWRLVRIVHGVAVSVQEQSEEKIKELEAEVHKLEEEKQKLSTKFDYIKKRYKKLVDAHKEQETEEAPIPKMRSHNRLRIDDVYDATTTMHTPPRNGSQSFSPSPFKSPGAPNILSHHIISINDDTMRSTEDVSAAAASTHTVASTDDILGDEDIADILRDGTDVPSGAKGEEEDMSTSDSDSGEEEVGGVKNVPPVVVAVYSAAKHESASKEAASAASPPKAPASIASPAKAPNPTAPAPAPSAPLSPAPPKAHLAKIAEEEESESEDEEEQRRPLLVAAAPPPTVDNEDEKKTKGMSPPPYNTFDKQK